MAGPAGRPWAGPFRDGLLTDTQHLLKSAPMIFCRSEHFSSASPPSGTDLAEKVVEVVVVVVLVAIFWQKNSQFLMVIAFSWADFGGVF